VTAMPLQPAYGSPLVPSMSPPTPSTGGYSQSYPPVRRKKRPGNVWASAALGGLIGCGLLALVVLIVTLIISNINQQARTPTVQVQGPSTADGSGEDQAGTIPTLDPTSAAARDNLIPSATPPAGTPIVAPVGVRSTEGVNATLQS